MIFCVDSDGIIDSSRFDRLTWRSRVFRAALLTKKSNLDCRDGILVTGK